MTLLVERAGPAVSVQDPGRAGQVGLGLSRGGAVDRPGFLAGAALLGQDPGLAALEMAGTGGVFRFARPTRLALSGARMRASLDGAPLEWPAAHLAPAGGRLEIGAAEAGVYGYLHLGGGIAIAPELGGRGFHRIAGLGRPVAAGDDLPLGTDPAPDAPPMRFLPAPPRSGPLRVMPGPQTDLFPPETRARFAATRFVRSARANRQGVRLEGPGAPFAVPDQLNQVSDFIAEGDIQMTGDGTPYVLLADCQTMGGYPRIGTVIPADLPRVAQAQAGDAIGFRFVTLAEAETLWVSDEAVLARLSRRLQPRTRDPREMRDLLGYELIDRPGDDILG